MKEKLILWLIGSMPDKERFIKRLIKLYAKDYHLHENPVRKTKRSTGEAVI